MFMGIPFIMISFRWLMVVKVPQMLLMHATGATGIQSSLMTPLMRPIEACYARADEQQIAIIEMAAASGLDLLEKEERNPLYTSSYGTGEP